MDINKLMQQTQKIQGRLQEIQKKLAVTEVEGSAGAGMVKVSMLVVSHDLKKVDIDPSMMHPENKEILQDLVASAVNSANRKAETTAKSEMSGLTSGIDMPFDPATLAGATGTTGQATDENSGSISKDSDSSDDNA